MKGKVLFFDTDTNRGVIQDKNRNRYTFHIGEWLSSEPIVEGQEVSFDIPQEEALNIRARRSLWYSFFRKIRKGRLC